MVLGRGMLVAEDARAVVVVLWTLRSLGWDMPAFESCPDGVHFPLHDVVAGGAECVVMFGSSPDWYKVLFPV